MALQEKYDTLIAAAKQKAVGEIKISEQENVLYIDGHVKNSADKEALWDIYNQIDPDYRAGDLRLNLDVVDGPVAEEYVVKSGDNLSKIAGKYGIKWNDIFEANKDIIDNPDLIKPGWKLKIPAQQ